MVAWMSLLAIFIKVLKGDCLEIFKMLTCNMKDIINEINCGYKSIVFAAVLSDSIKIFEYLMEYDKFPNIDLSCIDSIPQKNTVLIFACYRGQSKMAQLLLNHPNMTQKIVNMSDHYGRSAFWWSCQKGLTDIVKMMIDDEKVDVNKSDNFGMTPLMIAIDSRNTDIVLAMIKNADKRKIDLQARFHFYKTTILDAAMKLIHGDGYSNNPETLTKGNNNCQQVT